MWSKLTLALFSRYSIKKSPNPNFSHLVTIHSRHRRRQTTADDSRHTMTITGHCNEIRQLEIIKSTKQHVHLFSVGLIRAKSSKCIASVIQYSWESPADLTAGFSYIRGKQSLQIVLYYNYMTVIPRGTCHIEQFNNEKSKSSSL